MSGTARIHLITLMIDDNLTSTINCVIANNVLCTDQISVANGRVELNVLDCDHKNENCEYIGNVFPRAFSIHITNTKGRRLIVFRSSADPPK